MAGKEDLESLRLKLEAKSLQRKGKIAEWNDWITFALSKCVALILFICGGLDLLNPTLFPHLTHPEMLVGSGIALLTGKSVISIVLKAVKASVGG